MHYPSSVQRPGGSYPPGQVSDLSLLDLQRRFVRRLLEKIPELRQECALIANLPAGSDNSDSRLVAAIVTPSRSMLGGISQQAAERMLGLLECVTKYAAADCRQELASFFRAQHHLLRPKLPLCCGYVHQQSRLVSEAIANLIVELNREPAPRESGLTHRRLSSQEAMLRDLLPDPTEEVDLHIPDERNTLELALGNDEAKSAADREYVWNRLADYARDCGFEPVQECGFYDAENAAPGRQVSPSKHASARWQGMSLEREERLEKAPQVTDAIRQFGNWCKSNGIGIAANSGQGNNCLILSLLQHAKNDYGRSHESDAAKIRAILKKEFPDIANKEIFVGDAEGRRIIDIINRKYLRPGGKPLKVIELQVGAEGPIPLAYDTGEVPVVVWYSQHHWQALYRMPAQEIRDERKRLLERLADLQSQLLAALSTPEKERDMVAHALPDQRSDPKRVQSKEEAMQRMMDLVSMVRSQIAQLEQDMRNAPAQAQKTLLEGQLEKRRADLREYERDLRNVQTNYRPSQADSPRRAGAAHDAGCRPREERDVEYLMARIEEIDKALCALPDPDADSVSRKFPPEEEKVPD